MNSGEEFNEYVRYVSFHASKSMDEISKEMEKRRDKTHGLLSDYGALYSVAREYGVDLQNFKKHRQGRIE